MYLTSVVQSIKGQGTLTSEDLYKLNEAIFNLPEEDYIDKSTALMVFNVVRKINDAYRSSKYDRKDSNFFYDYVALLGTLQNQHFFNQKQTDDLLKWLVEAVGHEGVVVVPQAAPAKPAKSAGPDLSKDIAKLEAENEALRKNLAKMQEVSAAVVALQNFTTPTAAHRATKKDKNVKKEKDDDNKESKSGDGEKKRGRHRRGRGRRSGSANES